MPNCNHPGATCVVGNFWTCKTPGCVNGPATAVDPNARGRKIAPGEANAAGDTLLGTQTWHDPSTGDIWVQAWYARGDGEQYFIRYKAQPTP